MKINYNISAMISNNALKSNDNELSKSIQRLSSGLKINEAKDNASGLAMAKRMNAQIRSLEVANQNANDGISVIEIAEGGLMEIQDMIQRMNELAVKSCNGILDDSDRVMINDEITQLKDEISRIASTTMYNGSVLLDGGYDLKGYTSDLNMKVTSYSDQVRTGTYEITKLITAYDADGNLDPTGTEVELSGFPTGTTYSVSGDTILLSGNGGFSMELRINAGTNYNIDTTAATPIGTAIQLDITGLGSMGVQIGTNEGQELDVRIATISMRTLGLEGYDCSNEENSNAFLSQVEKALSYVSEARSRLGAYQNRLDHTISTLDITSENMTAAYSRIMDVDMASEMTEYSKNQVLVQAGTSMLAQANERPSQVLQLLQ